MKSNRKIKVLVDAREFNGWDFKAAWDDLKFGLKHNKEFTKLAFVGNKGWESYNIKISDWFICGEMKYFEKMGNATFNFVELHNDTVLPMCRLGQ